MSERELDILIDELNTLNDSTPKIKCRGRSGVDPNLIFGLDSKLFMEAGKEAPNDSHHEDEVETVSLVVLSAKVAHDRETSHDHSECDNHGSEASISENELIDEETLVTALQGLPRDFIWRVKGFVKLRHGVQILNWAFGRFELHPFEGEDGVTGLHEIFKVTVMGERGEVKRGARKLAELLGGQLI